MDILNQLVNSLTKDEARNFKIWMQSTNKHNERKDLKLFDIIRNAGDKFKDEDAVRKLYPNGDRNSYYRLKNRLITELGYSLNTQHVTKFEHSQLYHWLSLYQIFSTRNYQDLALYFLDKACALAERNEHYETLEVIYSGYIKIASERTDIDPEKYITKWRTNSEKLQKIRQTEQVLAALTYRLKLSQNFGKTDVGLLKLLDNTIKEFSNDVSLSNSKSFQTQLFKAITQILIQNHNFSELEKFAVSVYERFLRESWFDKTNHDTKLQMLVYIVNSLFKNRKYNTSLDYAETLGEEMTAYNNLHHDKYLFFYYNALVINYAQIDVARGLKALNELEREMKGIKNTYYEFFILLNRANLLFFMKKFDEAIRNMVRLYGNDHYKLADPSLQLKILVAECIMLCESEDWKYLKKRIEYVRKAYSELLLTALHKRERGVLGILDGFITKGGEVDKKLRASISKFIGAKVGASSEDAEVIRYNVWLQKYCTIE